MATVPPKLEAAVQFLLPPACREEVLGDLCEKYTGPGQYIGLAMRVVPFVIASRIRRTTDAQVLLMEALLVYSSYVAAAWYTDRALLIGPWGLLRLAVPAVLTVVVLMLDDAWAVEKSPPLKLFLGVVIGTGLACLSQAMMLPLWLNLYGGCASLLLVSTVRIVFRQRTDPPQDAWS